MRTGLTDLIGAFGAFVGVWGAAAASFFDEDLSGVKCSLEAGFKVGSRYFWAGLSKSNKCDGASSECW